MSFKLAFSYSNAFNFLTYKTGPPRSTSFGAISAPSSFTGSSNSSMDYGHDNDTHKHKKSMIKRSR